MLPFSTVGLRVCYRQDFGYVPVSDRQRATLMYLIKGMNVPLSFHDAFIQMRAVAK